MPGMFCRHNRLTSKCPICSRELQEELRSKTPVRHVTPRKPGASSTPRARSSSGRSSGVVTRKLARAADDGYRNPLVPGLRATADAERLAIALTDAAARLEPPGPYAVIADEPDLEQATWMAFLFALAPELQERARRGEPAVGGRRRLGAARGEGQDRRRLPRVGRARRLAGGRVHRRGIVDRRSAASAASSSGSRCPASTAPPATAC